MSGPKRKLKNESVFDVDSVLGVVKPMHAYKLWHRMVRKSKMQFDDEGLSVEAKEVKEYIDEGWSVPKAGIAELNSRFTSMTSKVIETKVSSKGNTTKLLIEVQDGHLIETVIMQHHNYNTVCISSQIGCKMGCKFCATGTMGIVGNLTAGEIIEQVVYANSVRPIRNVVFMGMGEPLNNYDNVRQAVDFLLDARCFNLSVCSRLMFKGLFLYTFGISFHVEWCIRQL